MTVSNTTAKTSATGTGSTGQKIPFSFPIANTSDIVCSKRVTATGAENVLTETTDYSVTINGDSGGTVTTVTAIETTEQIHVYRRTPRTQTQNLTQGGTFNAEAIEETVDKLTRVVNDLQEKIDRCLKLPVTDPTDRTSEIDNSISRASKYAAYNSNGDPTVQTIATIKAAVEGVITPTEVVDMIVDVENLAAGSDITDRIIYVPTANVKLSYVKIATIGSPSGIDDSNTVVINIAHSDGNTILSKTYNTSNQPPSDGTEDLSGLIDSDYSNVDSNEHVKLSVTQGSQANMPKFILVLGVTGQ